MGPQSSRLWKGADGAALCWAPAALRRAQHILAHGLTAACKTGSGDPAYPGSLFASEATSGAVPPLSLGPGEGGLLLWACPGRWPRVLSPVPASALRRPSAGAVRTSRGPWTLRAPGMTTLSPTTSWTTSTPGRAPVVSTPFRFPTCHVSSASLPPVPHPRL